MKRSFVSMAVFQFILDELNFAGNHLIILTPFNIERNAACFIYRWTLMNTCFTLLTRNPSQNKSRLPQI